MNQLGCVKEGVQSRIVVFNFAVPGQLNVIQTPRIFEGGSCRLTPNRGRIIRLGIEGGIEVDQINTGTIEPTKNVEIVPFKDGLMGNVYAAVRRVLLFFISDRPSYAVNSL